MTSTSYRPKPDSGSLQLAALDNLPVADLVAVPVAIILTGLNESWRNAPAAGARSYHPGYYAAFLLDPDGNNIEAVHHGTAHRSAPSVRITF